jgi:NDP-hexose 4-ketoreductase
VEAATDPPRSAIGSAAGARIAVTGAQGLLGRHVTAALLAAGAEAVLGLGRSARTDTHYTHGIEWLGSAVPAPVPDELARALADGRYEYRRVDLADAAAVDAAARAFRPDAVIHTAAALRDAPLDELLRSNVLAAHGVVHGFAATSPARIVFTSSGLVYGAARGVVPFAEDGPVEPIDAYGATKRAGEDVARIAAADRGMSLVVARVFNIVGPGLQDRHLPALLAARISAIRRGLAPPELRLGPTDATRDFVDVRDVADALVRLATVTHAPDLVNVGSGRETPVRSVLEMLLELAGTADVRVHIGQGRRADVPRSVADVRRLAALGPLPGRDLRGTLAEMLAYFDAFAGR